MGLGTETMSNLLAGAAWAAAEEGSCDHFVGGQSVDREGTNGRRDVGANSRAQTRAAAEELDSNYHYMGSCGWCTASLRYRLESCS
ncbi:uncharacterized protein LOC134337218 isoform X1 [Mobula hypostoma]|uniref:uncharacterized protein LOC134337218 isoform X1 n=1 Tax=Mobula hypostoma TaxID=723540 RepID=UPI002FC312C1